MAEDQPIDWDERHRSHSEAARAAPHPALVTFVDDLEPGRSIDVGCGAGTDAVWLAEQGWDVTGIDVSGVALDRARDLAAERGVDAAGSRPMWASGSPTAGSTS